MKLGERQNVPVIDDLGVATLIIWPLTVEWDDDDDAAVTWALLTNPN